MKLINATSFKHAYMRVMKHSGTPEYIARGVAVGFFVAFFIPFSLQMMIALPVALLCRAAKLVALLCTWISNPVTIAFIYPLQCYVGSHLIRRPLSYAALQKLMDGIAHHPSWG